jgi:hypothetical protein
MTSAEAGLPSRPLIALAKTPPPVEAPKDEPTTLDQILNMFSGDSAQAATVKP